ncbi:MAG: type II secretion system protein GspK [Deltaproteobacteria bacterium]|nr:type II secretion system protein GspK [Deltaproteobacteria bacterium]
MRRVAKDSERGIALLMVLVALTVLGAMTADFMETNETYVATAVNERDAVKAEYLARSGVNLARLLLSVQPILGKSLNFPFWQYADMIMSPFSGPEAGGGLTDMAGIDLQGAKGLGVSEGNFTVKILDEDSKINVNMASDQVMRKRMVDQLAMLMAPVEYDPLFDRQSSDGQFLAREDVICEIIDWTDPDEDRCDFSGSEDPSYYQSLDTPYERKNAPFDSLEELHLVRGVDDDVWSTFVDPDPSKPEARVMTVWGKGKVNVNTAPAQVLFPLVCMMATDDTGVSACLDPMQRLNLLAILQAMITLRTFMPFGTVRDFVAAIESPEERLFLPLAGFPLPGKRLARQLVTTRSTVFSIYADGTVGKVTKRIHVVVDTEGTDMLDSAKTVAASGGSVLYWRMD